VLLAVVAAWAALSGLSMLLLDTLASDPSMNIGTVLFGVVGKNAMPATFTNITNLGLIFGIIAALAVTGDFTSDTIKNTVMYSYSRTKIFASKMILQAVAICIFLLVYSAVLTLIYTLEGGWGEPFTLSSLWEDVIKVFLSGLFISYAVAAFINFFAFTTKNAVLPIAAPFMLSIIYAIISFVCSSNDTPFLKFINNIMYPNVVVNYIFNPGTEYFLYYLLCFALLFVPAILVSFFKFRKQEI
jgi:ABC-type transport system involved in multi-copper enzyme maturation permease subunit